MAATFGEDLSPNFDDVIKRFGSAFSKVMSNFGIRMTPKVHIVLHHLPHCIRLTNMPPGLFSEQVVEMQNVRFMRFYDRYRVSCADHITYPDRLYKCVFYIIIPPIYNIIFQIMLVALLLFRHIGFTVALRNLSSAHSLSHRW